MKKLALCTAALSALFLATPTLADVVVNQSQTQAEERLFVEVNYADLNLDDTHGREMLDQRISSAVKTVCGIANMRNMIETSQIRSCRRDSREDAFAQRDALYAARLAAKNDPARLAALDAGAFRLAR